MRFLPITAALVHLNYVILDQLCRSCVYLRCDFFQMSYIACRKKRVYGKFKGYALLSGNFGQKYIDCRRHAQTHCRTSLFCASFYIIIYPKVNLCHKITPFLLWLYSTMSNSKKQALCYFPLYIVYYLILFVDFVYRTCCNNNGTKQRMV